MASRADRSKWQMQITRFQDTLSPFMTSNKESFRKVNLRRQFRPDFCCGKKQEFHQYHSDFLRDCRDIATSSVQ